MTGSHRVEPTEHMREGMGSARLLDAGPRVAGSFAEIVLVYTVGRFGGIPPTPGHCGAQDTFHVGTMEGVGRIHQQTFVDTYSEAAFAKLQDRKTPITAADPPNDRVLPFFEGLGHCPGPASRCCGR